ARSIVDVLAANIGHFAIYAKNLAVIAKMRTPPAAPRGKGQKERKVDARFSHAGGKPIGHAERSDGVDQHAAGDTLAGLLANEFLELIARIVRPPDVVEH